MPSKRKGRGRQQFERGLKTKKQRMKEITKSRVLHRLASAPVICSLDQTDFDIESFENEESSEHLQAQSPARQLFLNVGSITEAENMTANANDNCEVNYSCDFSHSQSSFHSSSARSTPVVHEQSSISRSLNVSDLTDFFSGPFKVFFYQFNLLIFNIELLLNKLVCCKCQNAFN